MSNHSILIIDDSATIRRLATGTLTTAGYRVLAAPTAEEGLSLARTEAPDLILLDHQLPGTTGRELCAELLADPQLASIPVVASSTLRKQAYLEYADCPNVIDMLPKPYTEELLLTTVEHAIDTGSMVVNSQAHGTAVPETIKDFSKETLTGTFETFSLREVLDFLNNGSKNGVLEIEGDSWRAWFYLRAGRIDAVTANGVDIQLVTRKLPKSLESLAPVLNLTVGGRGGSELDGLVQLLNNKILDPRLLQKMLRHQAAVLTWICFHSHPKEFRFETAGNLPPLFSDLPLQTSVLALLVEASLICDDTELPNCDDCSFVRKAVRGQNLDRAGLSAKHQKILGLLAEPHGVDQLVSRLSWERDEVVRVLAALAMAELVQVRNSIAKPIVVLFEPNAERADEIRDQLQPSDCPFQLKIASEKLALQLLLKRHVPDALVLPAGNQPPIDFVRQANPASLIVVTGDGQDSESAHAILASNYDGSMLRNTLCDLLETTKRSAPSNTGLAAATS